MLNVKQRSCEYQLFKVFCSDSARESNPGLPTTRQVQESKTLIPITIIFFYISLIFGLGRKLKYQVTLDLENLRELSDYAL